jgi:manganese/zinc/iron transport system ATP- binding protein
MGPRPEAAALQTEQLNVCYPSTNRLALKNITLQAHRATRVALVGANGAGKSTLLKTAAGLLRPNAGKIAIYGNPVGACHHRVAYLPQRGEIDWSFPTSLERLVMAGRYVHLGWFRGPATDDRRIVRQVLDQLQLTNLAQRQIGQLSGGQQQRALLARALAQEADLLLLDEPLNAVDHETREIIYQVMDSLRLQGKTLIVATHDLGSLTEMFDHVVHLREGQVVDAPREEVAWTS